MNHWMVKQEPAGYAWSQFVSDGRTAWTGVRNYQARNNLRGMQKGDRVFYYHSVTGKAVMGIAEVVREAYPDATAKEGDWACVDLVPVEACHTPVPLEQIKNEPGLSSLPLLRQSRLSVMPVTASEAKILARLGGLS